MERKINHFIDTKKDHEHSCSWSFFIELLEKAVQLLHSLVKLLSRQHIVFHRIHLGIIDIEGPLGCLLQLCKYPYIG